MTDIEEIGRDPDEFADEPQIEPGDVLSAARSCSAILIIGIVITLIACLALVLAKAF